MKVKNLFTQQVVYSIVALAFCSMIASSFLIYDVCLHVFFRQAYPRNVYFIIPLSAISLSYASSTMASYLGNFLPGYLVIHSGYITFFLSLNRTDAACYFLINFVQSFMAQSMGGDAIGFGNTCFAARIIEVILPLLKIFLARNQAIVFALD